MPSTPLPDDLQEFLRRPNPCVVATVRPSDGLLHTTATWYEWTDAGTVLLDMDATRRRLEHMRADPRVSLTVLDDNWYSHVSLIGHVREIRHDRDLADIDRISRHYTGEPYHDRDRDSWSAEIEVERWHSWGELKRD
jgi:PPOX class probable F420-dependent enzyme